MRRRPAEEQLLHGRGEDHRGQRDEDEPAAMRPAGQLCDGPLKLWMSCWNGRVDERDEELPADADGDADQVDQAEAHAEVAHEVARPWVRLASQGAPTNPIHRPSSVDTTYHSGGTDGRGDGLHLGAVLPAMAPATVPEDQGADLAGQEADHGVERASIQPCRLVCGGTQGGRGRARPGPAAAAAGGAAGRHRRPGAADGGGGDGSGARREPVGARTRRERARAAVPAGPVGRAAAGLGVGHRQDVTGAPRARHLQGRPPGRRRRGGHRCGGRRLAWIP